MLPTPHTALPAGTPLMLLAAFGIAFCTQLARQLMHETPPRPRRLLAAATAAGIAAVATCALLLEWLQSGRLVLLAVSSVVGWSGAHVLAALGGLLEQRLGVRLLRDRDPPAGP